MGVEERERDVPGDDGVLGVDLLAAVGVDMPEARAIMRGRNGARDLLGATAELGQASTLPNRAGRT